MNVDAVIGIAGLSFKRTVLINSSNMNHAHQSNYCLCITEEINVTTISFPSGTLSGVIKVINNKGVIEERPKNSPK